MKKTGSCSGEVFPTSDFLLGMSVLQEEESVVFPVNGIYWSTGVLALANLRSC